MVDRKMKRREIFEWSVSIIRLLQLLGTVTWVDDICAGAVSEACQFAHRDNRQIVFPV